MNNQDKQILAEKIAQLLLETDNESSDAKLFRESLEKINNRLEKIESQIALRNPQSAIRSPQSFHPSQERFLSIEQIADEIIEHLQNEKACPYEPTGKPCDNCAMCNSRGF